MTITRAVLAVACAVSVSCQPDDAAHVEAGDALFETGRYAEAVREYRAAVGANPSDPGHRVKLARALLHAHLVIPESVTEAIRVLKEAITIDPLFWPARYYLANALRTMGELTQAVEEYQAALRLNPADVAIHTALGKTYSALGSNEEARAAFEAGLKLDPTDRELHFHLWELNAAAAAAPGTSR